MPDQELATTVVDPENLHISIILVRPNRPIEITEATDGKVTVTWPHGGTDMEPDIEAFDLKAGRTLFVQLTGPKPARNVTQIAVGNNIVQSAGDSSAVVVVDGKRIGPEPIKIAAPPRAVIKFRYGDPNVTITGTFLRENLV